MRDRCADPLHSPLVEIDGKRKPEQAGPKLLRHRERVRQATCVARMCLHASPVPEPVGNALLHKACGDIVRLELRSCLEQHVDRGDLGSADEAVRQAESVEALPIEVENTRRRLLSGVPPSSSASPTAA